MIEHPCACKSFTHDVYTMNIPRATPFTKQGHITWGATAMVGRRKHIDSKAEESSRLHKSMRCFQNDFWRGNLAAANHSSPWTSSYSEAIRAEESDVHRKFSHSMITQDPRHLKVWNHAFQQLHALGSWRYHCATYPNCIAWWKPPTKVVRSDILCLTTWVEKESQRNAEPLCPTELDSNIDVWTCWSRLVAENKVQQDN